MLKSILALDLDILLLSGLHIGGSGDTFDIGGADSTVITNPLNNEPYIPGSSLKGKIRSLLERKYGKIINNELELSNPTIKSLFDGDSGLENGLKVSRAIFRDAYLTEESKKKVQARLGEGIYTEVKGENSIDSLNGSANPRFIERVPAGLSFSTQIILQIFDGDDEEMLKKSLLEGIKLLELNYLGGNGSRGYGRVQIDAGDFERKDENEAL